MKKEPELQMHYGEKVWTNPTTDILRREECLCLFCDKMTGVKETNCPIAQAFYEKCCKENVAFMMTRCKHYKPKNGENKFAKEVHYSKHLSIFERLAIWYLSRKLRKEGIHNIELAVRDNGYTFKKRDFTKEEAIKNTLDEIKKIYEGD